jgi:hypothetical protein
MRNNRHRRIVMRTTLAIDDDVLAAARGLAKRQDKSLGEIISALARQALQPTESRGGTRNGVPLLPVRAGATPVTPELIKDLMDESP